MPNYGIKVSSTGIDVKTATDLQKILSSEFNQFKIYLQDNFSITVPGGGSGEGSITIPHNLGYVPAFKVYVESAPDSGKKFLSPHYDYSGIQTNAKADTNNLYIDVFYPIVGPPAYDTTFDGYYFIFKDNLT